MLDSKALAEAITHPDLIEINADINRRCEMVELGEAEIAMIQHITKQRREIIEALRRNT